jgi:hypothetical protein
MSDLTFLIIVLFIAAALLVPGVVVGVVEYLAEPLHLTSAGIAFVVAAIIAALIGGAVWLSNYPISHGSTSSRSRRRS